MLVQDTMTYREMMTQNPETITAPIDDNLKATIMDWFQYRNVVDDDKFPVFINRVLNRDYERYKQILRVQPGTSQAKFDWLVGNYSEKEINNTGSSNTTTSNTTKSTTDTTGANTQTEGGSDKSTSAGNNTTTKDLTDTTTYSGSESNTRSGSETNSATHNIGATSGSQQTKNNQSKNTKTSGSPQNTTISENGTTGATKAGPMDAGIASTGTTGDGIATIGVSFGSHASQIQQTHTKEKTTNSQTLDQTVNESFSGNADTVTTSTAAAENTDSGTKTYNDVKDTKEFTERQDTGTHTGTESGESTGSNTTEYGKTVTGSNTGKTEQSGTASGDTIGSTSNLTRERYTGRTEPPADILLRAVSYIETTNAWQWLMPRLDVCFISVFDI